VYIENKAGKVVGCGRPETNRMTYGVWLVTYGVWRVACDVWRVTCDVWRVGYGV
jgi:hypothetical protein